MERRRYVVAAFAGLLIGLEGFTAWQYALPAGFESAFILNPAGSEHFRRAIGVPRLEVALDLYRLGFRAWLCLAWAGYLAVVALGARGVPLLRRRSAHLLIGGVVLAAACLFPPSLSCDVYGYVAYGRMVAVYGVNPYAAGPIDVLLAKGDPVGPFLQWNIPAPYGPLWISVARLFAWLTSNAPVFAQVLMMKLLGGAGVVAVAIAGRRVAERLVPGRGDLTLIAIGLNPLFVIEGAGNGHNDLVMMAFVVLALDAGLAGRSRLAALSAGMAAAIKFLPLVLVPWLVVFAARRLQAWWPRVRSMAIDAVMAALPLVVSYAPYWFGAGTLRGVSQRLGGGQPLSATIAVGIGAALVGYGALTAWVLRNGAPRMLVGWLVVAGAVFLFATGMWLPWYLTWIWAPALVRWERGFKMVSVSVFGVAVILTLWYSIPGGF